MRWQTRILGVGLALTTMAIAAFVSLPLDWPPEARAQAPDAMPGEGELINLRWHFAAGDTATYTIREVFTEETTDQGRSITQERTLAMTYRQTCTAAETIETHDGVVTTRFTLELAYQHVVLEFRSPMFPEPQVFDSHQREDLDRAQQDMALRPYAALVDPDRRFTLTLNPLGEVLAVEGYDDLLDDVFEGLSGPSFTSARQALEQQFSDEHMREVLSGLYHAMPAEGMRINEQWSRQLRQVVPFVGPVRVHQTYVLEGVEPNPDGDGRIATIGVTAQYRQSDAPHAGGESPDVPAGESVAGFSVAGRLNDGTVTGTLRVLLTRGGVTLIGHELTETFDLTLTASSDVDPSLQIQPRSRIEGTITLARVPEEPDTDETTEGEGDSSPPRRPGRPGDRPARENR